MDDSWTTERNKDTEGPELKGLRRFVEERPTKLDAIEIPKLQLPSGGGTLKGIDETFTVNAANGTATMNLALPLSPGRAGFTPKLSLNYSSGNGNGPFGMGWALNLPSIQRRTDRRLPRYLEAPDEDVFLLAGTEDLVPRLQEVAPGNWQPVTTPFGAAMVRAYLPRVAGDQSRIERIDDPAIGTYWKVTDRFNFATIYGRSPATRLADPSDPSRIFRWLPEFSYDSLGNWIAFGYRAEDGAAEPDTAAEANRHAGRAPFTDIYLKRVRYGNRTSWYADGASPHDPPPPADDFCHFELVFDYGEHDPAVPLPGAAPGRDWDWRADAFSSYRAGFEVRTARLCRRVLMFHHFPDEALGTDALVRSLDLGYAPVSPSGAGQAAATVLVSAEQAGYLRRPAGGYSRKALPPLDFSYQPLGWDMTQHDAPEEALVDSAGGASPPWRLVDLYSEGAAGLLCDLGSAWLYKRNRGADPADGVPRFERGQLVDPCPNLPGLGTGAVTLEDLDGNGEKALVALAPQTGGFFALRQDEWQPFRAFPLAPNLDLRDDRLRRIDLTGDGRLSILMSEDEAFVWFAGRGREGFGPAERVLKALDEESGPSLVFAEAEQTVFLADMSGDGLSDIVRIRSGEVSYWPNLGYGRFGARVAMSDAPSIDAPDRFDPSRIRLAQLTGTGPADMLYLGGDGVTAWLNLAGNGWSAPVPVPGLPRLDTGHSFEIADLLGRGTPCIVWSARFAGASGERGLRYLDPMGGRKPHLMTGYVNNMGKEVALEYRASTEDYFRDRDAGEDWATRLPFPVQVVARQVLTEHVSGARLTSAYTYHHGYWDPVEREFRGFGRVDRTDTEDYETWRSAQPQGPLSVSAEQYQAPMMARTWYHVGAYETAGRLFARFEDEYWPVRHDRSFPAQALGALEPSLPDARLVAAPVIQDPGAVAALAPAELREAQRACKALVLRQEVFALDAPPGAGVEELRRQMLPFTVDTHSVHIELLQPRGPNAHAVFLVAEDEGLKLDYDRDPADPRISHAVNLRLDELGNVLEAARMVYGRDPLAAAAASGALAAGASDYAAYAEGPRLAAALADALDRAEASQTRTSLTVGRYAFTNDIDTPGTWRTRLPCESERFEITGLAPAGRLFLRAELQGLLGDAASAEIPFEAQPGAGVERRRIERSRTAHYDEALAAELPHGQMASHGLPFESRVLAFTPSLIGALYGPRLPAGPPTDARLAAGGYRHDNGDADWWLPQGRVRYLDPGEALADARARFFRPRGHIDPFGAETAVGYRGPQLMLIESLTDAAGNVTRAEAFDFRTMSPTLMRDANDVLSAVVTDELALVTALALLGRDLDGDGVSEADLADALTGQSGDSAADAANVAALLSATDSAVLEPLARQLLRQATLRFAYDLDAFRTSGRPAVAATITRVRHHADDPASELHLAFEYTDGSGGSAMSKTQAEPGRAARAVLNPDGTVALDEVDTAAQVPPRLRWVGTGRLVRNNKGKAIRRFEPYFSVTPAYENLPELTATGASAELTYDAAGRLVRTDMPDGTFQTADYSPWAVTSRDTGDTVAASRWHAERVGHLIDAELTAEGRDPAREAEAAASAAAAFADTPSLVLVDAEGRPILALDHLGRDGAGMAVLVPAGIVLDVEGNAREVFDARGNRPMACDYDLAGRRLCQAGMDGGRRWMLPEVTGRPLLKWDERGHEVEFAYDAAGRPISERVRGGDGPRPLDNVVMRAEYGEGEPNDRQRGLRGQIVRRWDLGGLQEWRRFDAGGNLLETARRFARDYRATADWQGDLLAPLEAETHVTRTSYDAIGRPVTITAPDGSLTTRRYSPANLLTAVDAAPGGGAARPIVAAITHDAKGQRTSILLGNGTRTDYRHDPLTFRLLGIVSTSSTGQVLQDLAYTHDCAGNLTHREDRAVPTVYFGNTAVTSLARFGYDALYRLTSAEGREHAGQNPGGFGASDNWDDGWATLVQAPGDVMAWRNFTESYEHDPVGNMLRLSHAAGPASFTRSYACETATNRLVSSAIGADIYPLGHHPAHGFVRSMPHLSLMAHNHRDELCATARQAVTAGVPETTWYVYDHDGNRIRKVTDRALAGPGQPARKDERLFLGALEIFRSHAGATAGLERRTLSVLDDRARIAMIDSRNDVNDGTPGEVTRFQLANHLGSVAVETDGQERLLSYEEYHPYGSTAYRATGTTLPVAERRYRYTGMERDEESGLSYHSARYYAPWIGRWIKPDPAALRDGINDYQYASGNPVRLTDPTGLDGWDRFWGGVKMVGGALETFAGGSLVAAGVATSEIGVGVLIGAAGLAVTAHGADVTQSGARTMWNGEQVDTVTSGALQEHAGLTRGQANLADAGLSIVFTLGGSAVASGPRAGAAAADAVVAGDEAVQVARGSTEATAALASRGPTLVHLTTAEGAESIIASQTLGRGGTIYVGQAGLAAASDTGALLRTGLTASQTPNAILIPEAAAGAFQAPRVLGIGTAWQRISGTLVSNGAGEVNLVTGVFTRTGPATNQIFIQGFDVVTTSAGFVLPAVAQPNEPIVVSGVGSDPIIIDLEPSATHTPLVTLPAAPAPVVTPPDEAACEQSSSEATPWSDPSSQVSSQDGYYDTVEGVCYAR